MLFLIGFSIELKRCLNGIFNMISSLVFRHLICVLGVQHLAEDLLDHQVWVVLVINWLHDILDDEDVIEFENLKHYAILLGQLGKVILIKFEIMEHVWNWDQFGVELPAIFSVVGLINILIPLDKIIDEFIESLEVHHIHWIECFSEKFILWSQIDFLLFYHWFSQLELFSNLLAIVFRLMK